MALREGEEKKGDMKEIKKRLMRRAGKHAHNRTRWYRIPRADRAAPVCKIMADKTARRVVTIDFHYMTDRQERHWHEGGATCHSQEIHQ
ncbi:hypothetical protein F2P79_007993 [Pimephales promelas]|nr:hypothetical protein F2P79_007993 [Pimephales promelas]